jgi:hypothetical protein
MRVFPREFEALAGGPNQQYMRIGTSLFVIAVGAILKLAVHERVDGFRVHTAGLVLMIVGIVGLLISLFLLLRAARAGAPPPAGI